MIKTMRHLALSLVLMSSLLLTSAVVAPSAQAFQATGQSASTVIGEPNFVSSTNEDTPNHLFRPFRIAFDSSGDLWVVDENNNRVLEFKPPFTDGESASLEIGQANFTSIAYTATQDRLNEPVGLAFDQEGDLWVMDTLNNRILEFKPPFTDGMNASLEIGQPAGPTQFTTNSASSGPGGFNFPVAAAFDSHGDLWVSDRENNRVLEFKPPFTDGMSASSVVGQQNLTSVSNYVFTSPNDLSGPNGLAFDSQGDLWVADESDNRVLEFPASSLGTDYPAAVLEIGQYPGSSAFYSSAVATNQTGFANPLSIAFDSHGDLWVSDRANNRVMEFATPFANGMAATAVIGTEPGPRAFDQNDSGLAQSLFTNPLGIAFDSSGDLWVADQLNNRVLEFSGGALATAGLEVNVPVTTSQSQVGVSSSGDSCYRTGEENVCHLTVDETNSTKVSFDMIGVAQATEATVYSSELGAQEPSYAQAFADPISSPVAYYGVSVSGLASGTATVCVEQQGDESSFGMTYFTGTSWGSPTSVTNDGGAVCGTIPLTGIQSGEAMVAIGVPSSGQSHGSTGLALAAVFVGAVLICGYAVIVRRRGEPLQDEEPEEEGTW